MLAEARGKDTLKKEEQSKTESMEARNLPYFRYSRKSLNNLVSRKSLHNVSSASDNLPKQPRGQ